MFIGVKRAGGDLFNAVMRQIKLIQGLETLKTFDLDDAIALHAQNREFVFSDETLDFEHAKQSHRQDRRS